MQRERTGKLTLRDLAGYFHLPLEIAAEKLNLCPTVIKRICRRDGLKRWPHRKVRLHYPSLFPSLSVFSLSVFWMNISAQEMSSAGADQEPQEAGLEAPTEVSFRESRG